MQVFCPRCGASSEVRAAAASARCSSCGEALPIHLPAFGPPQGNHAPHAFGVEDMAAVPRVVPPKTKFVWVERQQMDGVWEASIKGSGGGCAAVVFLACTVVASYSWGPRRVCPSRRWCWAFWLRSSVTRRSPERSTAPSCASVSTGSPCAAVLFRSGSGSGWRHRRCCASSRRVSARRRATSSASWPSPGTECRGASPSARCAAARRATCASASRACSPMPRSAEVGRRCSPWWDRRRRSSAARGAGRRISRAPPGARCSSTRVPEGHGLQVRADLQRRLGLAPAPRARSRRGRPRGGRGPRPSRRWSRGR